MDIYFSGSIRGGRQDAGIYQKLIQELSRYGNVLTEHVGHDEISEAKSDRDIHNQDMEWLRSADVVIAEVTRTSHGVGYEIGWAAAMDTPVFCLYRPDENPSVSAMLKGSDYLTCYTYDTPEEAAEILSTIFNSRIPQENTAGAGPYTANSDGE